MKIEKNVVVSIAYQVKLEDGIVVDQSTAEAPLEYLHGHNNLITGLERELEGKVVGDKFSATVAPEDAYGEHSDELVQRVPAEVFQGVDEIEVGMRFLADTDQGPIPVEITEVDGDGFRNAIRVGHDPADGRVERCLADHGFHNEGGNGRTGLGGCLVRNHRDGGRAGTKADGSVRGK